MTEVFTDTSPTKTAARERIKLTNSAQYFMRRLKENKKNKLNP
jgi:hypothetical protein